MTPCPVLLDENTEPAGGSYHTYRSRFFSQGEKKKKDGLLKPLLRKAEQTF